MITKKKSSGDSDGFTGFQTPLQRKSYFWNAVTLCLYVWTCASLAPERVVEVSFIFGIQ
jgi:hypothetical protein